MMKQIEQLIQQGLTYFSNNPILLVLLLIGSVIVLVWVGWRLAMRKAHALDIRLSGLESDLRNSNTLLEASVEKSKEKESNLNALSANHAGLKATLEEKEKQFAQQTKTLEDAEVRLTTNFENLANKIFADKQKQFSEQSSQSINALLDPFKLQLSDFRKRVDTVHTEQTLEQGKLTAQLDKLHDLNMQLTDEASQLTQALKGDKKMQGNWGEIQIEMILDRSGLIKDQEYQREPNFKDEESNNLRPDFVINLPDNKRIVIDSKVSLVDFSKYIAADDDVSRNIALKAHVKAVEQHIRSLSNKDYTSLVGMNSPDFVLMFMPIEPAFLVAFQHKQELYYQAYEKKIIVVTPSTLLATLKTVASLWSIERQNKNARNLAEQGGKIYEKLRLVLERMSKLGQQLDTAQKTFTDVERSLSGQGSLTSTIGKFKELGVRVKKEIPAERLEDAGVVDISDDNVVDIVERLESDQ